MDYIVNLIKDKNTQEIVNFFKEYKININHTDALGNTLFTHFCIEGDSDIIEYLLKNDERFGGIDLYRKNVYAENPLHFICYNGDVKVLLNLFKYKKNIPINTKDVKGNTPLIYSCTGDVNSKSSGMVRILVQNKPKGWLNTKNKQCDTVIDICIKNNSIQCLEYFLYEKGDKLNKINYDKGLEYLLN
ncbi:MAG: ankyrin repeat domain-containing protein [Cyclobacteriaceae bacterium]